MFRNVGLSFRHDGIGIRTCRMTETWTCSLFVRFLYIYFSQVEGGSSRTFVAT